MTPYVVQYVADSYVHLRDLEPDCVDVAISDPPYSAHVQRNISSGTAAKGKKSIPSLVLRFAPLDAAAPFAFIADLLRATRRWVVVFCSIESLGLIQAAYPNEYVRGCMWLKPNSMGQLTSDRPACAYEALALLHKTRADGAPKKRWNGKGSYGVWRCNSTRGLTGRHPNEKPIALCQKLVALFSERGETVFDPFAGSGAIGQAALSLGRSYVGLDQSQEWVARAQERLAAPFAAMSDTEALGLCQAFGADGRGREATACGVTSGGRVENSFLQSRMGGTPERACREMRVDGCDKRHEAAPTQGTPCDTIPPPRNVPSLTTL